MAIDWSQILNTSLQLIPQLFGSGGSSGSGLNLSNLAGAGLLGAGLAGDKEPGEVTEARQFLRNQFTSPNATTDILARNVTGAKTALAPVYGDVGPTGTGQNFLTAQLDPNNTASRFTSNVSAVKSQYEPLLKQQRDKDIAEISQRFAAAFPSSVGAQGPEFGALGDYIVEEALPREQALYGDLGLNLMSRQDQAARDLYSDEQARRQSVASAGGGLLGSQLDSAKTILNTSKPDAMSELTSMLGYDLLTRSGQTASGGSLPAGGQGGQGGIGDIVSQLMGAGGADLIGQLLTGGGAALGSLGPALSSVASVAGPAAAAAALGYGLYSIGKNNPDLADEWYGKISPLVWLGADKAQKAQKAEFRRDDVSSQLDQVNEIGNIGAQFLADLGVSQDVMNAWASKIQGLAAASEGPGDEQGMAAQELGRLLSEKLGGAASSKAPQLRAQFISYMMGATFTSGNSSYGGGAPANFIESWAGMAGLKDGGLIPHGGAAVVGEEGREIVKMTPRGAMVIPMKRQLGGRWERGGY